MIDPTVSTAALASLELLCNRALTLDPASQLQLRALGGQSLRLDCKAPQWQLDIHLQDAEDCLRFSSVNAQSSSPSACLRGSAVDLFSLLWGEQHSLAGSGVELLGSSTLLIKLQAVFKQLDLDWEEPLTQSLGDVLGHQVAESLRAKLSSRHAQAQSLTRMLGDYLIEERRLVLGRFEFDSFASQLDNLRADAERVEAKVAQSAARLKALLDSKVSAQVKARDEERP